jgi:hypothetical protein
MNLNQALQVMLRTHIAALNLNHRPNSIEMKSGPGVGKSSTVFDMCGVLAKQTNEPVGLTTNMLATIQSPDVRGFMLPQKAPDGSPRPVTVFSLPPWYPTLANIVVFTPDGQIFLEGTWQGELPRIGVVFLDEFGQGEDDVKKASAELLLHGQVGTDRLPVGWRVLAASNRLSDRAGVLRPLTFITNRRMEMSIDADPVTWQEWAAAQPPELRPHHLTLSFAHRQPDLVFRDAVPPGDAPFCTPRALVLMDRDLRALRTPEDIRNDRLPMDAVAREVCAGWIGGGESAQFFVHIKFADELPDIDDIEQDPMKAKLPAKRDGQMVAAFMLASHVTEKNAVNVLRYIERLNIEMQVLSVTTITAQAEKARALANNRQFSQWLLDHKDVLVAARA